MIHGMKAKLGRAVVPALAAVAVAAIVLAALIAVHDGESPAWAAYVEEGYAAGQTAGRWTAGPYQPLIRVVESSLTHPSHADGLVDKGDPVYISDMGLAGVAFESASAATDYVNIALRGIVNLTITNTAAMSIGDDVYLDTSDASLSDDAEGGVYFGKLLNAISGTGSAVVRTILLDGDATVLCGQNGEVIENASDGVIQITANDDAAELLDIQIYSVNTSTADNDYYRTSYYIEDSASEKTEIGGIDMVCTDVTTATEDSRLDFRVITAGTVSTPVSIDGTDGLSASKLKLGSGGSTGLLLWAGQVTIETGATSATQSISGVDSNSIAVVSWGEVVDGNRVLYAVPEAGAVDVVTSPTNGTGSGLTVHMIVYDK